VVDDPSRAGHPSVDETRELWEAKAAFWDAGMGEGNLFQQVLVGPAAERLLRVQPSQLVLDVACGNGVFSRRLAELGARVVATDFSETFLELARQRTTRNQDRIEYRLVDATNEEQLLTLGVGRFDAVVCNMALMDMPVIEPLLRAIRQLLQPGGRFVFSVQHPAFNSNGCTLGIEEVLIDGRLEDRRFVRVSDYLSLPPGKGPGMPGEPVPHWYFQRSIGELLGSCFASGLLMDGIEEPAFGPEHASDRPLSWANFTGIPPVVVASFCLSGQGD
jgi:SAM-dependent methyltransferase